LAQAVTEDCSWTSQDAIHQDDEKGLKGLRKKCGRVKPPLFFVCKKVGALPLNAKKTPQGLFW
jgi:hypothetical protein